MNDKIPIYIVAEGQSFSESAGILQLDVFEKDLHCCAKSCTLMVIIFLRFLTETSY